VPHLGNVNEIMRGFVVAEVLRERGHEVRQVFTTDDRDPLRKLPRKLADLDGNVVDLGEVNAGALGKNLGHPYTDIPDPFGCCDSYGDHFSKLIEDSATLLGVDIDVVSTTELYESGEFEDLTRYVLEHQDEARAVLSEYQDKIDEEYVPFNPICSECGKITETVTAVDLDAETVEYECTDMEAGDQTIQGCGHEGTATFREGKLPWRFGVARRLGRAGRRLRTVRQGPRRGVVALRRRRRRERLRHPAAGADGVRVVHSRRPALLPPRRDTSCWSTTSCRYSNPRCCGTSSRRTRARPRDFSVERLDQTVDDFDRTEAIYFGEESGSEREEALADRTYPLSIRATVADVFADDLAGVAADAPDDAGWQTLADDPEGRVRVNELLDDEFADRVRIPYTFAAVLGCSTTPTSVSK